MPVYCDHTNRIHTLNAKNSLSLLERNPFSSLTTTFSVRAYGIIRFTANRIERRPIVLKRS